MHTLTSLLTDIVHVPTGGSDDNGKSREATPVQAEVTQCTYF